MQKIVKVIALASVMALGGASFAAAQPTADPSAPPNPPVKAPSNTSAESLAKGHNSFTRGQAKSRIEKAGYTNVSIVNLDSDGLWQATATRDGQSVHVALDYKGNVATQ